MRHYIAILLEDQIGEWRAILPDLPECEAKGFSLGDARIAAESAMRRWLEEHGSYAPRPMDMSAVERNEEWLTKHGIDLSKAVVSMVAVADQPRRGQGDSNKVD